MSSKVQDNGGREREGGEEEDGPSFKTAKKVTVQDIPRDYNLLPPFFFARSHYFDHSHLKSEKYTRASRKRHET